MVFDVGSAVGYLLLDTSKWTKGLGDARKGLKTFQDESATAADKFTAMGNVLNSTGKALTLGVTTPLVGLGAAAVKTSADFEAAMSNLEAISGATAEEMDLLNAKAQEMGAKTKFSASEAAQALTYMAMAGWETQSMLDGIEGIMSLAAASGEDLASTSDIVTDALTAFGLTAADTQMFVDTLAMAANATNTSVSLLGESFKYVAPVAGTLGYSVQDVGAALGFMANSGIKGSQAGTALRAALTRMIKPTEMSGTAMEKLGLMTDGTVTAMVNADGSMKSFRETMVILREKFSTLTAAEQANSAAMIFGQEAMSGMLSIINASDEEFNKLISSMDSAGGTAQDMAETQLDNLTGQLTILKSGIEAISIAFGNLLMPMIKDVVAVMQRFVDWVNSLDEGQKRLVVTIGMIVAAIGPVMLIVGKLSGLIGKLIPLITGAGGLSGALTVLTGPVGIVIASIVALVAAWTTNFAGIRDKTKEILGSVGEIISSVWGRIKSVWDNNLFGIQTNFMNIFNTIRQFFSDTFDVVVSIFKTFSALFKGDWEGFWEGIKEWIANIWKLIVNLIGNFLNTIVDNVLGILVTLDAAVRKVFNAVWEAIKSVWKSIIDWFKKAIQDPVGTILGIKDALFNAGKTIFTSLWDGIKNIWTSITSWVTDKINWLKDKIAFWKSESDRLNGGSEGDEGSSLTYGETGSSRRRDQNPSGTEGSAGQSSGGDTYNFYSPTPITPTSAARELKRAKQELALGYS